MAGLFEETGRFLAMRYVLKKEHGNAHNALMYGAGHGGLEMFVILSLGMINNLIYSVMINLGRRRPFLILWMRLPEIHYRQRLRYLSGSLQSALHWWQGTSGKRKFFVGNITGSASAAQCGG